MVSKTTIFIITIVIVVLFIILIAIVGATIYYKSKKDKREVRDPYLELFSTKGPDIDPSELLFHVNSRVTANI
jgi:hypothetical protein